MGLRFRWRPRLGALRFNVTERGLRSVSLKVGPFTWNPTRRRVTTNLPGGLYHEATYDEPLPRLYRSRRLPPQATGGPAAGEGDRS